MVAVLAPPALYAVTGGEPPTITGLRERYARQAVGHSPDGDAGWLNWIIRRTATGAAIGYVQATVTVTEDEPVADLAWLITPAEQGRGAAVESALAVLGWLPGHGVRVVRALIRPGHSASERVAERLGLTPTPVIVDGERVWERMLAT